MSFNRIVYETLEVCNAVDMAVVEAAVARTGLASGARAADVGTGNAAVALRLAERFGFRVEAIEFDPIMADLARSRIEAAGRSDRVTLTVASAAEALADATALDLITALGTTNLTGEGRPSPEAGLAFLAERLAPGGWLLWGDLVWLTEPPAPLRQIVETTNQYVDDAGWTAAAQAAGLELVWREISDQSVFDAYVQTTADAVAAWLEAHPDTPEAEAVRFHASRTATVFEFGRGMFGFGLYLFRRA